MKKFLDIYGLHRSKNKYLLQHDVDYGTAADTYMYMEIQILEVLQDVTSWEKTIKVYENKIESHDKIINNYIKNDVIDCSLKHSVEQYNILNNKLQNASTKLQLSIQHRDELIDYRKDIEKYLIDKLEPPHLPYDYSEYRMKQSNKNNEIIKKELLEVAWHPDRDFSWYYPIDELEDILLHFSK